MKRFCNAKRDRRTQCLQIGMPIVCVVMAMSSPSSGNLPSLEMSPGVYCAPLDLMVNGCSAAFVSQPNATNQFKVDSFLHTPMNRAYDFSNALLATSKSHGNERPFSYFCGDQSLSTLPDLAPMSFNVIFANETLQHSAGMDPQARRTMWDVIQRVAKQSSVVLTTHHLEEVEALATRVSIMVDGAMKCIAPLQRLKTKFGSGFEMSVRVVSEGNVDPLIAFVRDHIGESEVLQNRNRKVTFALPKETKLSAVFSMLEANKMPLKIEDYAVSQTTLEQVFLRICATSEHHDE